MALTDRDRRIQRDACPGCHQDRYNHRGLQEREVDCPVTSEKCWHVDGNLPRYDRKEKRFVCPLNTSSRIR